VTSYCYQSLTVISILRHAHCRRGGIPLVAITSRFLTGGVTQSPVRKGGVGLRVGRVVRWDGLAVDSDSDVPEGDILCRSASSHVV